MHVRQQDLPFHGMSYHFVGADHGPVAVSAYLVEAPAGRRTRLHSHPYDTVAFVREGRGRWIIEGEESEAGPGDIIVVKAGKEHWLGNIGESKLVVLDIHLNDRFVQEDLD